MSQWSKLVGSNSTQFWFRPSECQSKSLHFNRQTWLDNHMLRSLISNSDFPIFPKLANDFVNCWPSSCFLFVTTTPNSSIKFPMELFQRVAQSWAETLFLRCATNENDWICSKSWTFGLTSKFKLVFLHKKNFGFFKKIKIEKNTLVKEDSMKNHLFSSSHQKFYTPKIPRSAFYMENVSIINFILLQIYSISFFFYQSVSQNLYTSTERQYCTIIKFSLWFAILIFRFLQNLPLIV